MPTAERGGVSSQHTDRAVKRSDTVLCAMSDGSETDDLDAIRSAKREQLLEESGPTDTPVHVESVAHLDELVADGSVVLVDFYADWCGPCRMLEPTVETIAAETPATVAKVDVDELQDLASLYNVQGVPTLLLFADGAVVERTVGVQTETALRTLVDEYSQ